MPPPQALLVSNYISSTVDQSALAGSVIINAYQQFSFVNVPIKAYFSFENTHNLIVKATVLINDDVWLLHSKYFVLFIRVIGLL